MLVFYGETDFSIIPLVENKAFLDIFRNRKMGKAILSGKRGFSSGLFPARISGSLPMG